MKKIILNTVSFDSEDFANFLFNEISNSSASKDFTKIENVSDFFHEILVTKYNESTSELYLDVESFLEKSECEELDSIAEVIEIVKKYNYLIFQISEYEFTGAYSSVNLEESFRLVTDLFTC